MTTKIAICLLTATLLGACSTAPTATTSNAARHSTLEQRMLAQNQVGAPTAPGEPAPPAEGPEDVPANRGIDIARNPALVPSPLLRQDAAGGL